VPYGPLRYNNGYVQHRPHVYLIFWGSDWNNHPGTREKVLNLYQSLSGSSYAKILTQYFDHGGYIGSETDVTQYTDTHLSHPIGAKQSTVREEVAYSIEHQGWGTPSYENQYVVFAPPEATWSEVGEWCGYHQWWGEGHDLSFTSIPYPTGQYNWSFCYGNGATEAWQSIQETASHEWAESATNPIPYDPYAGWDGGNSGNDEIADSCGSSHVGSLWLNALWDDYLSSWEANYCVTSDASPVRYGVATYEPSIVTATHSAELHGAVNPAGYPAWYQFEFTHNGEQTLVPNPVGFVGEDQFSLVNLGGSVSGLKGETTYHVKLNSTSLLTTSPHTGQGAVFSGEEKTFTTPNWRPAVTMEPATDRTLNSVTLHASINPQGYDTHYRFEYGRTTSYGSIAPAPEVPGDDPSIGEGVSPVHVSAAITGLRPERTYHYRVVAYNVEGESVSGDKTFTTMAVPATYNTAFATKGSGNGQLSRPLGIARDSSGNLWVADADNNRIEKFNSKGEYLSQFGSKGSGNGQFDEPVDVAFTAAGNLWVTDAGNGRIEEFNPQGEYLQQAGIKEGILNQDNLTKPYGVAIDSEGRIWVTDSGGHRVDQFKETAEGSFGHFVSSYGGGPFENPALNYPAGIAADSKGNMWIADAANNLIYQIHPGILGFGFQLDAKFGSSGSGEGQLSEPRGVAVKPSGNLAIVEKGNNRVQLFSPAGEYLGQFGTKGSGEGQLSEPRGVVSGPGGTTYVTDGGNNRIEKWSQPWEPGAITQAASAITTSKATLNGTVNPSGEPTTYQFEYGTTTAYGSKAPAGPESVGSGSDAVAVSQTLTDLATETTYHYRVVATSAEGTTYGQDKTFVLIPATYVTSFGTKGSGNGQLSRPLGIARDASGNLWVADADNNRIEKFNAKGEYLSQFGTKGSGNGQLSEPRDVAITAAGNLWVSDAGNGRIQEFNSKGEYIQQAGIKEGILNLDNLAEPYGIAIDPDGRIWVSDLAGNKVVQFKETAEGSSSHFVNSYNGGSPTLKSPAGIAADSKGNVWIADLSNNEIYEIHQIIGLFVLEAKFGASGSGDGQLSEPRGIAVKPSGNLMVVDKGNNRVQLFSPAGEYLGQFGTKGTGDGQFTEPRSVVAGLSGTTYVTDGGNNRIEKWSQPWEPGAITQAASNVTSAKAILNGTVNPNGEATTYQFEYGTTTAYGSKAPASPESVGSGIGDVAVSKQLEGLKSGTTYHFRVVAINKFGTSYGEDRAFKSAPVYQFSFGSYGSGNGQFNLPLGMAVDKEGNVWVADHQNDRIQKFNSKGEYLSQFGTSGSGNGQLDGPGDIAIDKEGNLWVVDGQNNRIEKFNSKGEYLSQLGNGQFGAPACLAIDLNGNIWVTDYFGYGALEFKPSGELIRFVNGFGGPQGIAVDEENHIWVVDLENNFVEELSSTGERLVKFGSAGEGNGQFKSPYMIDVLPGNRLLVGDATGRVQEFSSGGQYITQFGAGKLSQPSGIATDLNGAIFVASTASNSVQKWFEPGAPTASTKAATGLTSTKATVSGTVNPSGEATTYQFEYGTTTAYGSKAPASPESVGSGTSSVEVSKPLEGLQPGTTYHFRVVATNELGTANGEDKTFQTESATSGQLGGMAVTEPFNGSTSAVSNFGTNWSALGWASGGSPKGSNTAAGWGPTASYPTVNGAFFTPTVTDVGSGIAAVATMTTNPGNAERYFSLWLDMSTPSSTRAGYELRFTNASTNTYNVTLSKWVGGSQTVLASKSSYSFVNGNSFAVADQGGTVSAWTNTGSGFSQLLSASDATFAGGNAGVGGSGNITRLTNFKVGQLLSPVANMDAALKGLPVNDSFGTSENPLSGGGAWAALAWDNSTNEHNTGWVSSSGWAPFNGYPTINGAHWQKATFADTGAGDAVAATLVASPGVNSRYFSLWLDMPSPASAQTGYELRFTQTASGVYEVALSKWQAGTKTVLASKSNYSFSTSGKFALADKAGTVSAWINTGSEYTQLLSAADSAFTSGYTGIEGSGSNTRLTNFQSGPLPPL
jgi:streptogramin lyase